MEKAILNQHTPGDWQYDDVWSLIMGPNGEEIAAIHAARGPQGASKSTAKANARLIVAAPNLLEACDIAQRYIGLLEVNPQKVHDVDWSAIYTQLRAAIAKARGQ